MPEGAEIENLRYENCLNLQIEGTSLNGKELGQGITQRKDGRYQARFTD